MITGDECIGQPFTLPDSTCSYGWVGTLAQRIASDRLIQSSFRRDGGEQPTLPSSIALPPSAQPIPALQDRKDFTWCAGNGSRSLSHHGDPPALQRIPSVAGASVIFSRDSSFHSCLAHAALRLSSKLPRLELYKAQPLPALHLLLLLDTPSLAREHIVLFIRWLMLQQITGFDPHFHYTGVFIRAIRSIKWR